MRSRQPHPVDDARRPVYLLHVRTQMNGRQRIEIYQHPSPATPRLRIPEHVASISGRALDAIEARVSRRLAREGVKLRAQERGVESRHALSEDLALTLALLFRAIAPMTNVERMRLVATGIESMSREEAGYWLGMTLNRKQPRRVLAALRVLMTSN